MTDQINDDQITTDATEAGDGDPRSSRRSLVSKGAIAAAVGAAAGLALNKEASAANNDPVLVGNSESGTNTTLLFGGTTFEVFGGNSTQDASIYGHTAGTGGGTWGVLGSYDGSTTSDVAGVYGRHTNSQNGGTGVLGTTDATSGGTGVRGESAGTEGIGVRGVATNTRSIGVSGEATTSGGVGVQGNGARYDISAAGSGIVIISAAQSSDIIPTSSGTVGSLARNSDGALWYCVGTNTWKALSGSATAGAFHALTPFRAHDSRQTSGGGRYDGDSNRTVSIKDARNVSDGEVATADVIPAGATAIAANIAVIGPTTAGFMSVNPGGDAVIAASSVNYNANENTSNAGIFTLNTNREVEVVFGPGGGGHVAIDVTGYWT